MFRGCGSLLLLAAVSGCVTPPDVVIEVGEGRPELSGSGEATGSGEGSGAAWEPPGRVGQSVLAVQTRPGAGWSVGVVLAEGAFVGVAPYVSAGPLQWRDASGRAGSAELVALDRATGLYLAQSDALAVAPLAMAEAATSPITAVVGHPTFGLDRGGWLTLAIEHATELCGNGLDDDSDGEADCFDGACASDAACASAWPEDCRNGIDDDADGLTDCSDENCDGDRACEENCDGAAALPLPEDTGLDGGAMLDGCGRLVGLVGIAESRFGAESSCGAPERTAVALSAPLEPLACVSGARPLVPLGRIRALLDIVALTPEETAACDPDGTIPIGLSNESRGLPVSGTTLAMLRRARGMVYAGPGFSAVKVANPPLLVAPTGALPRMGERSDELVGIDGTTVSLASSFQRPEPISGSLSALFYPIPTTSGFPLAPREEAVAGNDYYLIGQPETLGCGAGWVVNMVKLVAFGAGDELIFEGVGYSAGAAIVTPTGGLLAIATGCEAVSDGAILPAEASEEPLTLSKHCAIIGSRIPTR